LETPPIYLTLVTLKETSYLVISISHTLYDGWSLSLMHEDVRRAYLGTSKQRPSPRALLQNIFNFDKEKAQTFWKRYLYGVCASNFPISFEDDEAVQTYRKSQCSQVTLEDATAFCKTRGITLQVLGQACWAMVLAHYLGTAD